MAERSVITFFSEDRLETSAGRVVSADCYLADWGWARGLADRSSARFAARVDAAGKTDGFPVQGRVLALPYYQGGIQLMRKAPRLTLAVWRAVSTSDVIAVRLPGAVSLLAVAAAVAQRRLLVVELVGDAHEVLTSGVGGPVGRRIAPLVRALTRWAVARGDVVRYVTQRRLQETYPPNAAAKVFAFSDVQLGSADFEPPVVDPDPSPRIIAIGSQEQTYKGHDLLIRVAADLRSSGHEITLALLGKGRFQSDLRQQAVRLAVSDQVEFLGHVAPRSAVMQEIDRAWVFAMPSRTEGLPRALVEAMARGKACVVTDVGGMPELVEDSAVVRRDDVLALATTIRRFLMDEGARIAEGTRNRNTARDLACAWSAERARWASLLESIIGGAKGG